MIAEPPSEAGAVQVTVEVAFSPDVAFTVVGASGLLASGRAEFDGSEAIPVPRVLVAVTVKV